MQLQYKEEHLQCRYYATEHTSLFRRWHFSAGDIFPDFNKDNAVLLYISAGSADVVIGKSYDGPATANRLLFLPHNISFFGKATKDTALWTCIAPANIPLCRRYDLNDLQQDMVNSNKSQSLSPSAQITVNKRVEDFFRSLGEMISDGVNCVHFHEMKRQELFILLRAYYTKEELYSLFSPLIAHDSDFRRFVYRHYREVADVPDFAGLANMTVRSFQRRFKAEFGCSVREWLLRRRAEFILRELRTTDKDLSDIAYENGFSTVSYFSTFCKQHLGVLPSDFRRKARERARQEQS